MISESSESRPSGRHHSRELRTRRYEPTALYALANTSNAKASIFITSLGPGAQSAGSCGGRDAMPNGPFPLSPMVPWRLQWIPPSMRRTFLEFSIRRDWSI